MPGKKKISTHHLIIKDQLANFPALNNFVLYQKEKDKWHLQVHFEFKKKHE